jgi:hypothetical protein
VACYASGARAVTPLLRPWTHYLNLDSSVDVRDSYPGQAGSWLLGNADTVHVPSGGTTAYVVIFVEVRGKGTPAEHKRVYLDRLTPAWPAL